MDTRISIVDHKQREYHPSRIGGNRDTLCFEIIVESEIYNYRLLKRFINDFTQERDLMFCVGK